MGLEEVLLNVLPCFRIFFKKTTFCLSVLSQLVRAFIVVLKPSQKRLQSMKMVVKVMMFSTKGGKSAYDNEAGIQTKGFRHGIIRNIIENSQYEVFKLFEKRGATGKKHENRCGSHSSPLATLHTPN